jgi:hypothetical protein
MTRQADFRRRVRARLAKTGESYATARSRLLGGHPGTVLDDSPSDWMPEALLISNGDATDVPGTGLARRVIYWRDVLHEGRVPEVAPAELCRIRAEYLAGDGRAGLGEVMRQFTERDQAPEADRDGEYVLWFEADLYDQLQIPEILARLAGLGVPAERITLICIGEHAGIARFGGLGELTAGQLRELPHTNACARLTAAALELATRAWATFRAPAPGGLGAISAARLGELRFLGEAFDRLGRGYPATRDGLSLTERRVVAAIADGAPGTGAAFARAQARETRPNALMTGPMLTVRVRSPAMRPSVTHVLTLSRLNASSGAWPGCSLRGFRQVCLGEERGFRAWRRPRAASGTMWRRGSTRTATTP